MLGGFERELGTDDTGLTYSGGTSIVGFLSSTQAEDYEKGPEDTP